jgi:hypothetical protein
MVVISCYREAVYALYQMPGKAGHDSIVPFSSVLLRLIADMCGVMCGNSGWPFCPLQQVYSLLHRVTCIVRYLNQ